MNIKNILIAVFAMALATGCNRENINAQNMEDKLYVTIGTTTCAGLSRPGRAR